MRENEAIILVDEDGVEHSFTLIDVVMVDDNRYALLEPNDVDDEDEEGGAYLFRLEMENGDERLVIVDDDEEFERVVAVLEEFDEDDEHIHGPDCDHDHDDDEDWED